MQATAIDIALAYPITIYPLKICMLSPRKLFQVFLCLPFYFTVAKAKTGSY